MSDEDEFLMLMRVIRRHDRAEYRKVRAEVWDAVARSHARKDAEQIKDWSARAS